MSRIDPFGAGLTLGFLMGVGHAIWIALVALTAAPWVAEVVIGGEVVRAAFAPDGVDLSVAAFLIVMTTLAGCGVGWLFATIWNGLVHLGPAGPVQEAGR